MRVKSFYSYISSTVWLWKACAVGQYLKPKGPLREKEIQHFNSIVFLKEAVHGAKCVLVTKNKARTEQEALINQLIQTCRWSSHMVM